jgi:hypothetical protein
MFRKAVVAAALLLASGLAAREGPPRPKIYGVAFVRLISLPAPLEKTPTSIGSKSRFPTARTGSNTC